MITKTAFGRTGHMSSRVIFGAAAFRVRFAEAKREEVRRRAENGKATDEDRAQLELPRHALHAERLGADRDREAVVGQRILDKSCSELVVGEVVEQHEHPVVAIAEGGPSARELATQP